MKRECTTVYMLKPYDLQLTEQHQPLRTAFPELCQ